MQIFQTFYVKRGVPPSYVA